MRFIKNVQGSKELAVPLIVQKTLVYVKKNIQKIESTEEEYSTELYQWDEYQYDKDEYIELMQHEIEQKDLENKIALAEIYEMVVEISG